MEDKPIQILLVEDNPGDARLLQEMLADITSPSFELTHLERLGEALRCLGLGKERFDAILLDLSLPDEQGFDTFVQTHTQAPQVPIIVLTGLDDEALAMKAVRKGAQDYLVKGQVDANLLVRATRYAIERKQAEEGLRHYSERLKTLHEIDQAILAAQSPETVAQAALSHIRQLVPCCRASVAAFDFKADAATIVAAHVNGETKLKGGVRVPLRAFRITEELGQGQVRMVEDILSLSQPTLTDQTLLDEGVRSYVTIPLVVQDAMVGTLNLGADIPSVFASEHVDVAREVARSLAVALENARLYEQARREIAERVRAEEQLEVSLREKEVLLKEIHHRVKNNLQIITSLLNLQSGHIEDEQVREMFTESQNRVRSMALIHERLYQSPDLARVDLAGYVRNLATSLFHSYRSSAEAVALKIDVQDVALGIDTAIPCGLILNELMSNVLKHAFPEGREGEIYVGLCSEEGQIMLTVGDDGIGFPADVDFRNTKSLGLQLVITMVEQLEGTIELDGKDGTTFKIAFVEPQYKERSG
jgi:two-component sensor histidine kinase/DNA-binding response OmpR family regulator